MSRRVLFIIGTGAVGGREGQLLSLAQHLAQAGWHPGVVFLVAGGPIADELKDANVPIWLPPDRTDIVEMTELSGSARPPSRLTTARTFIDAIRVVRRAARAHRPDVVHAMLPTSIWLGLPALACLRPRPRRVAGVYGFTPAMRAPIRWLYRRELGNVDAVVCNAPHLAEQLISAHETPLERTHVIMNGVDLPENCAAVSRQPPTAVVVANFHAYKGHADLLYALAQMAAEVELTVRLCGTGRGRAETRQLAVELGLHDRVVFVDPPADVARELQQAQFAVHPSRTEGLSNAILEQLAAGLPVVACAVGGNPVLVTDAQNGFLVPAADSAALADAVVQLATDPDLRRRMGAAARTSAERLSWAACTRAHIDLYAQLGTGSGR